MPASRPSSGHPGQSSSQPEVSRPRGKIIDAIEQEGITWEGQASVVGHDGDIAVRLIITTERLLLTNGDAILLETPRSWLAPAPFVVADNGVRISMTPEGAVPGRDTTERLHLRIQDGRGPAVQLVAILTGRATVAQMSEAEFPQWNSGVGAGRANMLPSLPAFETRQDEPHLERQPTDDPETRGVAPLSDWRPRTPEGEKPSLSLWAPDPEPVEASSRAARFLSERSTVHLPENATEGNGSSSAPVTSIEDERRKRGAGWLVWTSRIAVLALVVLAAGWFSREYLPDRVTNQLPAFVTDDLASNGEQALPEPGSTSETGDGTNGADNDPADIMPTEAALGLGGASTSVPDGEGGQTMEPLGSIPTPTPTVEEGDEPVDETGEIDNSGQDDQAIDEQDDPAPTEPVIIEAPDESEPTAPTGETNVVESTAPVEEPVTAPTTEPTVPAGQAIVPDEPEPTAPAEQTIVVQTPEPTVTAETPAPTAEAPASTPEVAETPASTGEADAPTAPTLEPQPPSVNPENPPEQVFADEGFRYSVDGAATGASLEELPEVAEVSYGEWIVLAVNGKNWTGTEQVFDMTRFTLLADGQPIQLDVGNSWVASLLSYAPAYGNTDAILWAAGEEHQFVLTFLAPNEAESLVLQVGDQQFDLGSVLSEATGLANVSQGAAPETVDATVVDVIDGETIVIEKDGIEQTVRYLGIDAPTEDDCFAAEATEANRALVAGQPVKIERQATNVDAQGNWVRDVWVENDEGTYVLVAHQLVKEGAAEADISQPNTRFTGWLRGAESVARAEALGLWGACGSADSDASLASAHFPADVFWRSSLLA